MAPVIALARSEATKPATSATSASVGNRLSKVRCARKISRDCDVASVNRLQAGTAPGTRAKMLP